MAPDESAHSQACAVGAPTALSQPPAPFATHLAIEALRTDFFGGTANSFAIIMTQAMTAAVKSTTPILFGTQAIARLRMYAPASTRVLDFLHQLCRHNNYVPAIKTSV